MLKIARRQLSAASMVAIVALSWASGCGSSDDDPGSPAGDAGGGTGGATVDAAWPDATAQPDAADAAPTTQAYDPRAVAAYWNGPTLGACGTTAVKEDFGSGLYSVHSYLLMAPAGVEIELSAERTAGNWTPMLIVHDEQGVTVHDGLTSFSTAALEVSTISPPPTPNAVGVRVKAATRMHLAVFLTDTSVASSKFSSTLAKDAKYTLQATVGCSPPAPLTVRGVTLDPKQELWVRYIAEHIVPKVPGNADERIDKSAHVTWWALKEGVLNVNNPLAYSNCSFPPDKRIGPVEVCPDPNNAWQVGLSGVQAAYRTLDSVETLALTVFPNKPIADILVDAAVAASFGTTTSLGQSIAESNGRLRLSWLLRNGPVGFEAQYSPVHSQCFVSTKSWCFGTGWPTSASFAATQADAQQAVADLKGIFTTLSP